jgi:hypothetical protein
MSKSRTETRLSISYADADGLPGTAASDHGPATTHRGAPLARRTLTRASVTRLCPAAFITSPRRRSHMLGTRQTLPDRPYRITNGLDNLCVDRTPRGHGALADTRRTLWPAT